MNGRRNALRIGIETGEALISVKDVAAVQHYALSSAPATVASGLAGGSPTSAVLVGRQTYHATRNHVRYQPGDFYGETPILLNSLTIASKRAWWLSSTANRAISGPESIRQLRTELGLHSCRDIA